MQFALDVALRATVLGETASGRVGDNGSFKHRFRLLAASQQEK